MKKRFKLTLKKLVSRAEADSALGEFRALALERARRLLEIEQARKAAEDLHAARLSEIDVQIEARSEQLRIWAEANPSEFGDRKSLDLTHGTIGWRIGQPTLKTITGWTWDRVVETLQGLGLREYLRETVEPAKAAILAQRENLGEQGLRQIGVKVVQAEPFFVEPKIDEADPGRTSA